MRQKDNSLASEKNRVIIHLLISSPGFSEDKNKVMKMAAAVLFPEIWENDVVLHVGLNFGLHI